MTALLAGTAVGLAVAHLAGGALPRDLRWATTATRAPRARRAAAIALLGSSALLVPPAPALVAMGWWSRRRLRRLRAAQARERVVRGALPDLVDLLVLATTAGISLPVAHPLVARHLPDPIRARLLAADEVATLGRPRADALVDALAPLGDRARALADVLVDHLRYGVPLIPALERTGLELRLDRRRAAERDARRVPVRLLSPLVTCVLPAFALLTVVPLLAASLEGLPI